MYMKRMKIREKELGEKQIKGDVKDERSERH